MKKITVMKLEKIIMKYYKWENQYSAYAENVDGLHIDAKEVKELQNKLQEKIKFRKQLFIKFGKTELAENLERAEIIFEEKK